MGGPLPLAVALLAVLALIGLTRMLGFVVRPALAGAGEAESLAHSIPGGFASVHTDLATDGAGALLRDASGRIAVIAPIGAHFLVRLNEGDWVVQEAPDGQLAITGGDFACRLALDGTARQWLGALNGPGSAAR